MNIATHQSISKGRKRWLTREIARKLSRSFLYFSRASQKRRKNALLPPPFLRNLALALVCLCSLLTLSLFHSNVLADSLPQNIRADNILEQINQNDITTVEEFIEALPPLYKKFVVLVYKSEALHNDFVSGDHPRVISWGADGRFVLTWTTDPDSPARESVEFLQPGSYSWDAGVIDFSGYEPRIVRPAECADCHGRLNKPLWGEFPVWEGTENENFGSTVLANTIKAMNSTNPMLEPLEITMPTNRHIATTGQRISFGESWVEPAYEIGSVLAWRHAEVLFNIVKSRKDYMRIAKDEVCPPLQYTLSRTLPRGVIKYFAPEDHHLSLLRGSLGRVQGASLEKNRYTSHGYYTEDDYSADNSGVGRAFTFLVLHDFYRTDSRIAELYRSASNIELVGNARPKAGITQYLNYPYGEANGEEELLASYDKHFVNLGQDFVDGRSSSSHYSARSFYEANFLFMDERICEILNGDDENREELPSVRIDDASASERSERIDFVVSLSEPSGENVRVDWETLGASAQEGIDYHGDSGSVSFAPGEIRKGFGVMLIDDFAEESEENFVVRLSNPTNANLKVFNAETIASGNIDNDDEQPETVNISFGLASYSVREGESVEVSVRLSEPAGREIRVPLMKMDRGSGASDYSGVPRNLVFSGADTERSFTFMAADDSEDDDGESVEIRFDELPEGIIASDVQTTSITILDDDMEKLPSVSLTVSPDLVLEGTRESVTVTARFENGTTRDVPTVVLISVSPGTASASDFESVSAFELIIPPSMTSATGSFVLVPLDDGVREENEIVLVSGNNAAGVLVRSEEIRIGDNDITLPPIVQPPQADSSTPAAGSSTPAAGSSTPAAGSSTPAGRSSTPAGRSSTPAGRSSTPAGRSSTPAGRSSTPAGRYSTPAGRYSTPAAGSSTPAGRILNPRRKLRKLTSGKLLKLLLMIVPVVEDVQLLQVTKTFFREVLC